MRSQKINYFVVGCFVLAMLAAFVAATAVLTGRTGATDSYFAVYDNVTGVKFGTQVLYEGYPIGQVVSVTPVEEGGRMRFRVSMDVIEKWRIPKDSVAQIAAPSLLSAMTISIAAGQSGTALAAGSQIEGRAAADMFGAVSAIAGEISDLAQRDLRPLIANLNRAVGGFATMLNGDIAAFTSDLLSVTRDMSLRVPKIADDIEGMAKKLNASADSLQTVLSAENEKRLQSIVTNFDTASQDIAKLGANLHRTQSMLDTLLGTSSSLIVDNKRDLEKTVVDLRYVVDSVARNIDSINQNLEGTSRNMYEFSRQIRQNPGLLLGGTPPTDAAAR
jgi:phospholipid/cholesterol/gamma-HCH transport system substrate-binding protein